MTSTSNTFLNSDVKYQGGFMSITNTIIGKSSFTESGSTYSYGVAIYGGAIYMNYVTTIIISGSTIYTSNTG